MVQATQDSGLHNAVTGSLCQSSLSGTRLLVGLRKFSTYKQLALFRERKVKPRRANDAIRWLMAAVSRLFDWRMALVVVKPDTQR